MHAEHLQVDAVSACHSATLGAPQVAAAIRVLSAYHERFRGRLAPGAVTAAHSGSHPCYKRYFVGCG